jgi:pimeloyl-ACP methyl ester carboxylesterase
MRDDPAQAERSRHHRGFLADDAAKGLVSEGRLRAALVEQGVAPADADAYLAPFPNDDAIETALNWYRAAAQGPTPLSAADVGPVASPTLYLWGDADATVGRVAAEGTAAHVTGPFRFEVLPGVGHFVTDQAGERVADLIAEHVRSWPLIPVGAR